ncbi:hypothetical protein DFS33DRAFT_114347 [Desarmillaria ectypa]|nr:hypothetical protein DFS33DRAFT_114347 [Desarmillaria ectypa]
MFAPGHVCGRHLWDITLLYVSLHFFPRMVDRTYSLRLYGCWIIYDGRWMIVICPIVMYIAETGCGIAAVYIKTTFNHGSVVINPEVFPFIATLQAFTLATIIATSLMVLRIWMIQRAVTKLIPSVKNHLLSNTICVLIESTFIYTASVVVMPIIYVLQSNATYIVAHSVSVPPSTPQAVRVELTWKIDRSDYCKTRLSLLKPV